MCDIFLEPFDVFQMKGIKRCRKLHRCDCCHGPIHEGQRYWRLFAVMDGDPFVEKECEPCQGGEAVSDLRISSYIVFFAYLSSVTLTWYFGSAMLALVLIGVWTIAVPVTLGATVCAVSDFRRMVRTRRRNRQFRAKAREMKR